MAIRHRIINGDCLKKLVKFDSNSIDALCSDPPAGIFFMNRKWDNDKGGRDQWILWLTEIMEECYRVMKPGAHGFVWAIPRTSHWTATALENAGFEIRDIVTHLFGSGFPKSLNISKSIDKAAGAEREIIGKHPYADRKPNGTWEGNCYGKEPISKAGPTLTAPSTKQAKQWDGYGTALKPASEHWILIRKPLSEKTVAKNVLKWGVGGINIDKSRIPANNNAWEKEQTLCDSCAVGAAKSPKRTTQGILENTAAENADTRGSVKTHGRTVGGTNSAGTGCSEETSKENSNTSLNTSMCGRRKKGLNPKGMSSTTSTQLKQTTGSKTCSVCGSEITLGTTKQGVQGRFPANLILDDVAGEMLDRQSLAGGMHSAGKSRNGSKEPRQQIVNRESQVFGKNTGDMYRFGDSGGASRFFYCAKPSKRERNQGLELETEFVDDGRKKKIDNPFLRGKTARINTHPTVKAISLLRYLVRMITPPKGIILDPFTGSGSIGCAAMEEKFSFIGIELDKKDCQIARSRIQYSRKKNP